MTLEEFIYQGANTNREIINGTINWSSTSEGSDYWFRLYVNTKK